MGHVPGLSRRGEGQQSRARGRGAGPETGRVQACPVQMPTPVLSNMAASCCVWPLSASKGSHFGVSSVTEN